MSIPQFTSGDDVLLQATLQSADGTLFPMDDVTSVKIALASINRVLQAGPYVAADDMIGNDWDNSVVGYLMPATDSALITVSQVEGEIEVIDNGEKKTFHGLMRFNVIRGVINDDEEEA